MIKPIYPDDYFSDNYEVELVSHANIKQVPLTFYMMENDNICPPSKNIRVIEDCTTESVGYMQASYTHLYPFWIRGDSFLSRMVAAIETGDPARAAEF